jgi:hypothetical protein
MIHKTHKYTGELIEVGQSFPPALWKTGVEIVHSCQLVINCQQRGWNMEVWNAAFY